MQAFMPTSFQERQQVGFSFSFSLSFALALDKPVGLGISLFFLTSDLRLWISPGCCACCHHHFASANLQAGVQVKQKK
jgi:hypothetical protein